MLQKIFKIFDGRNNFWQWDTKQKLIVLDDRVSEVRFSNKNTTNSKRRLVYTINGVNVCNVPNLLLQYPSNLIACACSQNDDGSSSTIGAVSFAVRKQHKPDDYVYEEDSLIEDILAKIEHLENSIESDSDDFVKFNNIDDATAWASENGEVGDIIVVNLNSGWVLHIVEDDLSLTPIGSCDIDIENKIADAIGAINLDDYAKNEDLSEIAFSTTADRTTGNKYTLYINNGRLTMEEGV